MSAATTDRHITRSDIEAKLAEIKGEVDDTGERAKVPAMAIGAVVVVAIVGVAYLLGRRSSKKKTTVVEVRRL
jgi:transcriptional regulator NrdR family protein